MKIEEYNSNIIDEFFDQMSKDPWFIKLKRWIGTRIWLLKCSFRYYITLFLYRKHKNNN